MWITVVLNVLIYFWESLCINVYFLTFSIQLTCGIELWLKSVSMGDFVWNDVEVLKKLRAIKPLVNSTLRYSTDHPLNQLLPISQNPLKSFATRINSAVPFPNDDKITITQPLILYILHFHLVRMTVWILTGLHPTHLNSKSPSRNLPLIVGKLCMECTPSDGRVSTEASTGFRIFLKRKRDRLARPHLLLQRTKARRHHGAGWLLSSLNSTLVRS